MRSMRKLLIGLAVLAVLSPIGLYLPDKLKAGDAWGEWGTDTIKELVGYVPQGLEKVSSLWHPLIPDYAFKGWEEKGMGHLSVAYVFSAILGIALCIGAVFVIGKFLSRKEP